MVPFSIGAVRTATAACAAVALSSFGFMDANPSLFCYHQLLEASSSLKQRCYQSHFANKTVWIIGASSGIGEQLAYQIYPYCQKLILTSRRIDGLQRVANKCTQTKSQQDDSLRKIVLLPMDVTCTPEKLEEVMTKQFASELSSSSHQTLATSTQRLPPKLDCVIFNAGQGHLSTVLETDAATTKRMFEVNTIPPIIMTQILIKHGFIAPPGSQSSSKPQIVITSSVGGRMGVPLSASYAASKHALHGYVASLQAECSSWLRVDMICPGSTETAFFQNQYSNDSPGGCDGDGGDDNQQKPSKPSPLKMPVDRCAALSMTHICRNSQSSTESGSEAWIAQQPTLLGCYMQQYLPGLWKYCLNRSVGPKRLSLYEQGLDLYDPANWTGKNTEARSRKSDK